MSICSISKQYAASSVVTLQLIAVSAVALPAFAATSNAVFEHDAETGINSMIVTDSENNVSIWQQQQNNGPWSAPQTVTVNPTATTTVNNRIDAGSQNNAQAAGGSGATTVDADADTTVNNQVNAGSRNNVQIWQQQQNNVPHNAIQNVNVNPTATTTVNNGINAGSQNNAAVNGGDGAASVSGAAGTAVNNQVNAASQNNVQIWQQQQNNQPWNAWQNAAINPTANTTVNNGINAGAQNSTAASGGTGGSAATNTTAGTAVNNGVNAGSQNNVQLWQQQQNNAPQNAWQNVNVNPTATTTVNNGINAGAANNTALQGASSPWSWSYNGTKNASTTVHNGINAASQNNVAVQQSQQNNVPKNARQNVTAKPVSATTVNNGINAGSQNKAFSWWGW